MNKKPFIVNHIKIKNIMGVEQFEVSPGKTTIIQGANGTGKTSVLEALKGALSGGHDATLLKDGSKAGEVVVVFENNYQLKKGITEKKSSVSLSDDEGQEVKRAASMLKDLVDPMGLNPVKFLTAAPKDRIKTLLDSVPMELPRGQIKDSIGVTVPESDKRHPLEIIEEHRKEAFDARADTRRQLKEKLVLVGDIKKTLPIRVSKDGPVDLKAEFEECKQRHERCLDLLRGVEERVKSASEKDIQAIKDDAQRKIDQINKEKQEALEAAHNRTLAQLSEARNELQPDVDSAKEALVLAESAFQNGEVTQRNMEYVSKGEAEIDKLEAEVEKCTADIKALDEIKESLVQNLPLEGLTVRDGEIYIDGIPFDKVNTAKQIRFALSVAGMRDSNMPLVFVDGLEAFDKETMELFLEEAAKTDMQYVGTRVTDDPGLVVQSK